MTSPLRRLICVILAAPLLAALPSGSYSARAEDAASIAANDGVLFSSCQDHAYSYSFDVATGYDALVTVEVAARSPNGIFVVDSPKIGAPFERSDTLVFCGGGSQLMAGRYEIRGHVEACNIDNDCYTFDLAPDWFTMRSPKTRTALTATPRVLAPGGRIKFKTMTTDERPQGYRPTDGAWVVLEGLIDGRWRRLSPEGGRYSLHGRTVEKFPSWVIPASGFKVRARTTRDDTLRIASSKSRTVTIRSTVYSRARTPAS